MAKILKYSIPFTEPFVISPSLSCYDFKYCWKSRMTEEKLRKCMCSPLFGLQTCIFCLKLPQGLHYMSANSKALMRLRLCAGSPDPLLVAYAKSTFLTCACPFFSYFSMKTYIAQDKWGVPYRYFSYFFMKTYTEGPVRSAPTRLLMSTTT